ncbi:hypothetical protein BGE01nite_13600 [Brevifollis gellanilyticus]|uniref:Uncharacterized protein n=1 Tax=Brevifollis gellanilyticus TaxID=748831 RepID=A0A512M5Q7_9BACT|nr:hypothetical protein BGE01nite_13600 [Brevifollis gellanilyticus]
MAQLVVLQEAPADQHEAAFRILAVEADAGKMVEKRVEMPCRVQLSQPGAAFPLQALGSSAGAGPSG